MRKKKGKTKSLSTISFFFQHEVACNQTKKNKKGNKVERFGLTYQRLERHVRRCFLEIIIVSILVNYLQILG